MNVNISGMNYQEGMDYKIYDMMVNIVTHYVLHVTYNFAE